MRFLNQNSLKTNLKSLEHGGSVSVRWTNQTKDADVSSHAWRDLEILKQESTSSYAWTDSENVKQIEVGEEAEEAEPKRPGTRTQAPSHDQRLQLGLSWPEQTMDQKMERLQRSQRER